MPEDSKDSVFSDRKGVIAIIIALLAGGGRAIGVPT